MFEPLARFYSWFWYHTEFFIACKWHRRPYTYIMRDWIYPHQRLTLILVIIWYAGAYVVSRYRASAAVTMAIISSLVLAHLIWGSKWIPGEQENPEYNPDKG